MPRADLMLFRTASVRSLMLMSERDARGPEDEEAPCAPSLIIAGLMVVTAFLWSTPFLWTLVASFRPEMAGGIGMASLLPDYVPTLANFAHAFESGDFARLLRQHRDRGLRHPGGADRDDLAGRLCLRPPRLPRPRLHLLRLPAAAHAGAADPDRAQPAHHRRSRPLRHAARRDGALLRLGLRHLPDAPDLPPDPARLRGGRRDRRRARGGRPCGTCCCRWPSPA